MTSPEQSKQLGPRGAPDVRLAELLHRKPDDPAVLRRGRGRDQGIDGACIGRIGRIGEAAGAELRRCRASRRGGALLRGEPGLGLGAKLCLPARFLGLQLLDLALDPGEHLLTLGELALDRPLLARALGHDPGPGPLAPSSAAARRSLTSLRNALTSPSTFASWSPTRCTMSRRPSRSSRFSAPSRISTAPPPSPLTYSARSRSAMWDWAELRLFWATTRWRAFEFRSASIWSSCTFA